MINAERLPRTAAGAPPARCRPQTCDARSARRAPAMFPPCTRGLLAPRSPPCSRPRPVRRPGRRVSRQLSRRAGAGVAVGAAGRSRPVSADWKVRGAARRAARTVRPARLHAPAPSGSGPRGPHRIVVGPPQDPAGAVRPRLVGSARQPGRGRGPRDGPHPESGTTSRRSASSRRGRYRRLRTILRHRYLGPLLVDQQLR